MTTKDNKPYKQLCLFFQTEHDLKALVSYQKHSCGYCGTEDCSCSWYSKECDCCYCEDLFNLIGNGMISSSQKGSFKQIAQGYMMLHFDRFDLELEIERREDELQSQKDMDPSRKKFSKYFQSQKPKARKKK
jgi:hypothetical protein